MERIEFIKNIIVLAGQAIRDAAKEGVSVRVKPDESLVTQADLASEKLILGGLEENFPEDVILSEESGLSSRERRAGSAIWIIDPLDGTTNFANGYPFYSISIGCGVFLEDGSIEMRQAGILDVPRSRLYLAEKGAGATVDGRKLSVEEPKSFADSFLVTGFYYNKGERLVDDIRRFEQVALECQTIRRDGSAALDLALVAEGVYHGFWERGLQPWDVAAGSLLVSEAGGIVGNYGALGAQAFDIEGDDLVSGCRTVAVKLDNILRK